MASRYDDLMRGLENGSLDDPLLALYGADALDFQRGRVSQLLTRMQQDFGLAPTLLTSSPGRTELGGNHTDHNHGRVLTAAVHLDCLAAVVSTQTRVVTIHSQGFPEPIVVNLDDTALRPGEEGTPTAIVRGVADGLRLAGHGLAGFNACVSSEVPMGSGLSSSAAFEVLIGRIFNELANGGALSTLELARVARLAENTHFGKPCGFMDQIACAFMGVLQIDFDNPANPGIERVDWDFEAVDYVLAVVNTGGSHANLTPDYAAIPAEMTAAARVFGREVARGITFTEVLGKMAELRRTVGDRAALRLLHFIGEDERAVAQAQALRQDDMEGFLRLVAASGDSSWRLLQNCYSPSHLEEQPIPLALTLTEWLLEGQGAWRVQGGGFAGTIQVYVPKPRFTAYRIAMEAIFGPGSVTSLRVRRPEFEILRLGA